MSYDTDATTDSTSPNPAWRLGLTVVVAVHFLAVLVNMLAVRSGPWPMFDGPGSDFADTPAFLHRSMVSASRQYLGALRLDETGRYPSIKHVPVEVRMEAVLYDADGKEKERVTWPQAGSWSPNRPWEAMIAQALANDVMRPAPTGEKLYPKGQEPPKVPVWRSAKPDDPVQQLTWVSEILLTRAPDPNDWGPDEWGLALSRSYARYLCRTHGAASCEVRRRWKYQQPPFVVTGNQPLESGMFAERISTYGKVSDVN